MEHYDCPACSRTAIMWDRRCSLFLCHNRDCAASFPAPEVDGSSCEEAAETLKGLGVTQQWLDSLVREEPAEMTRLLEGWLESQSG